ncbi:mannosyltransferase [Saitoella coloradoensis]
MVSVLGAFSILLVPRLLASAYATIQDCDEVYNFWEAAHYLSHGNAFQTWEYSPEYGIRSWAYVGLHCLIGLLAQLFGLSKLQEWYFIRGALSVICALCEATFCASVSRNVDQRVGKYLLYILTGSAGMFNASAAFLPSSFSMYTVMLGLATALERPSLSRPVWGLFWFALGGLLGWPFSLAMGTVFYLDVLVRALLPPNGPKISAVVQGGLLAICVLAILVGIDTMAYRKLQLVPFNIVLYNVLSADENHGPDIFGTEPWWFYVVNLILNFNVVYVLAMLSAPLWCLHRLFSSSRQSIGVALNAIVPFYIWYAIFTGQPHKEERFFFVAYPALCLNGAVALNVVAGFASKLRVPRSLVAGSVLLGAAGLSLLRVMAIITSFSAPLHVYEPLQHLANATVIVPMTLCMGKEWHRFPSSYFLPDGVRPEFIKSAFMGLLPGHFYEEAADGSEGWRPGTWMIPQGMNDVNQEEMSRYVPLDQCTYLVDSDFPARYEDAEKGEDPLEPRYSKDEETWEKVACESFLDAERSGPLGRVAYMPLKRYDQRVWGEYCLLKRKTL